MKISQEERDNLKQISSILGRIHYAMMDDQFRKIEKETNQTIPPNVRLNMLLGDPQFAWLRVLSGLMTAVDEVIFQKEPITEEQMEPLRAQVRELFFAKSKSEFTQNYENLCRGIPELILEHGKLRQALAQGSN